MINELKEQLGRCEQWLLEDPNDQEVIDKANDLKARIESLEGNSTLDPEVEDSILNQKKRVKRKIRSINKKLKIRPENEGLLKDLRRWEKELEKLEEMN